MRTVIDQSKYSEEMVPKWSYWRKFKQISFEEAIYLSLNINPFLIPWMLEEVIHSQCQEIDERLEIAYSWSNSQEWFIGDIDENPSRDRVDLKGFVLWACNEMEWEVPEGFSEIGGAEIQPRLAANKKQNEKVSRNDLKLIGALYEIILQKTDFKSEQEIKEYLEFEYGELRGMGLRTLDTKLAAAKLAITSKKKPT